MNLDCGKSLVPIVRLQDETDIVQASKKNTRLILSQRVCW